MRPFLLLIMCHNDWLQNAVQGAKESVTDAAHDAKNAVAETVESVEDYLTADLSPHTADEAALQSGHIPSNTADVLASSHADAPSDSPTDIPCVHASLAVLYPY